MKFFVIFFVGVFWLFPLQAGDFQDPTGEEINVKMFCSVYGQGGKVFCNAPHLQILPPLDIKKVVMQNITRNLPKNFFRISGSHKKITKKLELSNIQIFDAGSGMLFKEPMKIEKTNIPLISEMNPIQNFPSLGLPVFVGSENGIFPNEISLQMFDDVKSSSPVFKGTLTVYVHVVWNFLFPEISDGRDVEKDFKN